MKKRIKYCLVITVVSFLFLSNSFKVSSMSSSMDIEYKYRKQFLGLCIWPGFECRKVVLVN
jgi:hypothetical protein